MGKKALILSVLFFSLLFSTLPAVASSGNLLQTGDLSINRFHYHYSHHLFKTSEKGFATLTASKTTPDKKIHHGFLYINHRAIPLKHFFKGDDLVFERKIRVKKFNHLQVFLLGTPGAAIQITVRSNDAPDAPTIISFNADPLTIIQGESSLLSWQTQNADSVTIDNGVGDVALNGTVEVTPSETSTYTLTATGPGGSATAKVTVNVTYPQPTVSLQLSVDTITLGDSAVLSWSSTNAVALFIDSGIGNVAASDSTIVSPTNTTTYTITAEGVGGAIVTDSATLNVNIPSPSASISANPSTIIEGDYATLVWTTSNAETVVIDNGIGSVELNGSTTVSPNVTTTYTLTATGSGGTSTATTQVVVQPYTGPPTVSFDFPQITVAQGEIATLSWTSKGADSAYIDNGVGIVPATATTTVTPQHTTIYTISATGNGGSAGDMAIVHVIGAPEPLSEGSWGYIYSDKIPSDATVAGFDERRFSLVVGEVLDANGQPIEGVIAHIHNHWEYGTCITDAQGQFTIPVDGGSLMNVVFEKQGMITSHRKVHTPWNDFVIVETVTMLAEDPTSTTVTFNGDPNTVFTHRSSPYTDEFGTRSTSIVFTGDNHVYLSDENDNHVKELKTITTRATEFVTPNSMPAVLPPTSAFTYCSELSIDGVKQVRFEKPVVLWVENFLGFEVGGIVPVGTYDRNRALWVAEENGIVVKLLDQNADGIVDALDANGDDLPDDLNVDGSFADEVKGLSDPAIYIAGNTYWRARISHFTPVDCNWPKPPPDAMPPNPNSPPYVDEQCDDCKDTISSYVEARSRIFHEDIPIPGTDMTLHYASNRVEGYKQLVIVPASGDTIDPRVRAILVSLQVGGKTYTKTLDPLPNQKAEFILDGRNRYGQIVPYSSARVKIGFEYDEFYYTQPSEEYEKAFARVGGGLTAVAARQSTVLSKSSRMPINNSKSNDSFPAGWSLSAHHKSSSLSFTNTLHKGNGSILSNTVQIVDVIAGGKSITGTTDGDGGPATEAEIQFPEGITVDAEGNLYIAEPYNHRVRMVDKYGIITTIAGNGIQGYSGDGGLATEASLGNPHKVIVDKEGNIYIVDNYWATPYIRKVDTEGVITTIAGNGDQHYSGDGGPAIQAGLRPNDIAFDDQGNLYVADSYNSRIRMIDTNGIITTVAGNGTEGYSGDEGLATEASFKYPIRIAIDSAGNLYICDNGNHRIRMVDTKGIINTIAGNGISGYTIDGVPATETNLWFPKGIAVDEFYNLYIADSANYRLRVVDATTGIIHTVAGIGEVGGRGMGGPAVDAQVEPTDLALDPSGNIYIAENNHSRILKMAAPESFDNYIANGGTAFTEQGIGYLISNDGRHEFTIDLTTGVKLRSFSYDADGNLTTIIDQFGNQTVIQRDINGSIESIISPEGLVTDIIIDANNNLSQITYPDSSSYHFEYSPGSLMTSETEPNGNRFDHAFNNLGRVEQVWDQEGGHWQYDLTYLEDGNVQVDDIIGQGNTTTYLDRTDFSGAHSSIITGATGSTVQYYKSADGMTVNKTLPNGIQLDFGFGLDPTYKFKELNKIVYRTPTGLEKTTLIEKTYQDTDTDGIADLIIGTTSVNDKATTLVHSISESVKTMTSPEGRAVSVEYDPSTLLTLSSSTPGLYQTDFIHDTKGRLISIATGARQVSFTYDSSGFMDSMTDPKNNTTYYTHDALGRVTGINRPDGSSLGYAYDANGNMTVLTNPDTVDHGFDYNAVNLQDRYQAPLSGNYSYLYDANRRLVKTTFPSGKQINNFYTNTQLTQIQTPEANIDINYAQSDIIESIYKGAESITYAYDGNLVTEVTLGGTLNQGLSLVYNNDLDVTEFTYAGATQYYAYDLDGLLTGAGSYTIARNAQNGLPENVSGGALNINRTFNGYGELDSQNVSVGGNTAFQWTLLRDNAGRIVQKTEAVAGSAISYAYTYDSVGRLKTVTKDGTLVESYDYELDGTRTYETNLLRGVSGRNLSYSDEDHLLSAGEVSYNYDVDGFLTTKTNGADETNFIYSTRGELLQVNMPDGRVITYQYDPIGRRIAKRINNAVVEKYLWQGLSTLLAIYDGSDNLIQRFEYADGRMPVAMTQSGSTYYFAYDQVGSLRVVTDAAGNVVKRVDYDSFGNILTDTNGSLLTPFGFAGGLHDQDTGLVRFGYRDYDPDTGRWTAKDPIRFAGGDTDLYGYAYNNPVNLIDPFGLEVLLAEFDSPTGMEVLTGLGGIQDGAMMIATFIAATVGSSLEGSPILGVIVGIETSPALLGGLYDMSHGMEEVFPNARIPGLPLGHEEPSKHREPCH